MQTAKTDMAEICQDIHQLTLTVIRGNPAGAASDVFDMLGRLDDSEKRSLWAWLSQHDPNLKQWLTIVVNQRKAA